MKAVTRNLLVMLAFLIAGAGVVNAQPSVKGKVVDADGQPLPGVVVLVSGTTNGTMTDDNGNYHISASENKKRNRSKESYYSGSFCAEKIRRKTADEFSEESPEA